MMWTALMALMRRTVVAQGVAKINFLVEMGNVFRDICNVLERPNVRMGVMKRIAVSNTM